MVATSSQGVHPVACQYFQAHVCVLFHPTEILRGFRTTVHIGNIRQTAVIEGIHPIKGMKSSDQASVMFRYEMVKNLPLYTNLIAGSLKIQSLSKLEPEFCFVKEELRV